MPANIPKDMQERYAMKSTDLLLKAASEAVRLDEDGNVWVNVEYARMMLAFSEGNWRRTERDGLPCKHVCRRSDGAVLLVMPYAIYGNKEEQFQYRNI